jgi:hypothetical protein
MDKQEYESPLDRLSEIGKAECNVEWQGTASDYVRELGLGREHIPGLIAIARRWEELDDYPKDKAGWAPVHAWRALAQLRATEATEPLLAMLGRLSEGGDDYHMYDFPVVFGMIGPPAILALAAYLRDPEEPLYARVTVVGGLGDIGVRHPEARLESLEPLAAQLARFEENEYELNGFLVEQLVQLKAVEAAETIERAFASDNVAEDICGYWGTVRQALGVAGMGLAPDGPPRPPQLPDRPLSWRPASSEDDLDRSRRREQDKKEKTKRKQQEKAKKRNRKRR